MSDAALAYLASPHLEPELKADLEALINAAKNDDRAKIELEDRFSEPLSFGTAGLRGLMAAGLRRMNKPNVRRATMALADIAKKRASGKLKALKAVVGFDTRNQSAEFALEVARVLAAAGFDVFLGERPLPTPFLCFAMRKLETACGVIITASHNPKEYNGYKAYDDKGGQLVAPWDGEVESAMNALPLIPEPPQADCDSRIQAIPKEIEEAFFQMSSGYRLNPSPFEPAKLLFTPFHGTGAAFVPEVFKRAGLPLHVCEAQMVQDGNFPTAPRPNPEEMAAFRVTIEDANRIGADAILANDPDADRLGVVIRQRGDWVQMTGNDMAALALDYLARFKGVKGCVVTTVVTSDFLAETAKYHGLKMVWCLTGFKNIAVAMNRLEANGETYAFGAEESIGSLPDHSLRDKDGVTAALLFGEMVGYYKTLGMNLIEAIVELQKRVGVFYSRMVNLEDPSPGGLQRFAAAMERIRNAGLSAIAGEAIISLEDYAVCKHYENGGAEPILDRPDSKDIARPIEFSNVLKFRLKSGAFMALRPSGTEPKLKVYLQSRTDAALLDRMEAEARALLGL
ncbi:MAG: phospho-sugar mutase [Holophagales bacterium]|jgi:phosphomannomutase|nr:phospho-sugar mutase [Holophagales bacterium]